MKKQIEKMVKGQKLNNDGAALLSVIIVTAFITILATTMLYYTSMNYLMKQTDYQNTKSFYKAEEALDALRAALADDISEAFQQAYKEVMVQYAQLEDDTRQAAFNGAFLDYLNQKWTARETTALSAGGDLHTELQALVPAYANNFISHDVAAGEAPISLVCDRPNGRFVIQNVRVRYAEGGYSSFICTDIAFCVPDLDLTHDASENNAWSISSDEREPLVLTDYIIFMNWTKY